MKILIRRFACLGKALHGRLWIDGEHVCDTLEHADRCLPEGVAPAVEFVASNGPCQLQTGQLAIGECRYLGFLIRCQEYYQPLMERLRKARSRHHPIMVVICSNDNFPTTPSLLHKEGSTSLPQAPFPLRGKGM